MNYIKLFFSLITACFFFTCDSGPKVIEAEATNAHNHEALTANTSKSGSTFKDISPTASASAEHKVVVDEVMNTEKYSYLNVTEGEDQYWIAISKRPVEIGATYYYRGGLMKKNFYSKEHDKVFETVYLVSNIQQQPMASASGGASGSAVDRALNKIQGNALVDDGPIEVNHTEGTVKLSELFGNMAKYDGQTIQITGKVVKVNPMIMNRNWLHVQDGSGEDLDLTITTAENIPLGHVVTLEGTIALNKDFGAGYRYDLIMEGAVLK